MHGVRGKPMATINEERDRRRYPRVGLAKAVRARAGKDVV